MDEHPAQPVTFDDVRELLRRNESGFEELELVYDHLYECRRQEDRRREIDEDGRYYDREQVTVSDGHPAWNECDEEHMRWCLSSRVDELCRSFRGNTSLRKVEIYLDLELIDMRIQRLTRAGPPWDRPVDHDHPGSNNLASLYMSLGYLSSLHTLKLADALDTTGVAAVARAVSRAKNLRRLSLKIARSSTGIDVALDELADSFRSHRSLRAVRFVVDDIGGRRYLKTRRRMWVDSVVQAFSDMTALEDLTIEDATGANHAMDAAIHSHVLARLLIHSSTLRTLTLEGEWCIAHDTTAFSSDEGFKAMVSEMKPKAASQLKSLFLIHPSDSTIEVLTHVLGSSRSLSLEELALDGILASEFRSFIRAFVEGTSNRSLKILRFNPPEGEDREDEEDDILLEFGSPRLLPVLEELYVGNFTNDSDAAGEALAEVICRTSSLNTLQIGECGLSSRALESLANALSSNPSLENLDLLYGAFNRYLFEHTVGEFFGKLSTNRQMKKLDLSENSISLANMDRFVESIEAGFGLETLIHTVEWATRDDENHLDAGEDEEGVVVATYTTPVEALVRAKSRLRTLDLGWFHCDPIDDADRWVIDWTALAQELLSNKTLESLSIGGSNAGEEDCVSLADSLSQNTTLKSLTLRDCNINRTGAAALAEALRRNTALEELVLLNNHRLMSGYTDVVVAFAEALRENSSLKALNISCLRHPAVLGEIGKATVLRMLELNKTLISLNLHDAVEGNAFFEKMTSYYLRLNKLGRGKLIEGAGRHEFVKALIDARGDLDCSLYLLKLNPRVYVESCRGKRNSEREQQQRPVRRREEEDEEEARMTTKRPRFGSS